MGEVPQLGFHEGGAYHAGRGIVSSLVDIVCKSCKHALLHPLIASSMRPRKVLAKLVGEICEESSYSATMICKASIGIHHRTSPTPHTHTSVNTVTHAHTPLEIHEKKNKYLRRYSHIS